MTDTARTLAQIKALLADNTSGEISPQDLRDAIQSIVAPVAGGGFDGIRFGGNYPVRDVMAANIQAGSHSLASGTWWNPSFSAEAGFSQHNIYDPDGLIDQPGFDWDGFIMPADSYVRLRPGWWMLTLIVDWNDSPGPNGDRRCGFWYDYRYENDPVMGNPFYFFGFSPSSGRNSAQFIYDQDSMQRYMLWLPVTSTLTAAGDAFSTPGQDAIVAPYVQQYSTGNISPSGVWFAAQRIGDIA